MARQPDSPRLIIADDNIRDVGGHFFELANLLLEGGSRIGYRGVLATHRSFDPGQSIDPRLQILPTFQTRRLVHWSLGVDGNSRYQRNVAGKSIGGSATGNLWTNVIDRLRPKRNPVRMLNTWAADLAALLQHLQPRNGDRLLINTGDDFAMLALAAAMKKSAVDPLQIDVLFHFALYAPGDKNGETQRQIGRQLRDALKSLKPHQVQLHATTDPLASQLRETGCGVPIHTVPYPTRRRPVVDREPHEPPRAVLAGLPRAEKGRGAIIEFLSDIEPNLLRNHRFRLSMQMPTDRWDRMIPASLHMAYCRAVDGAQDQPLEIVQDSLTTRQYHHWLDQADLGLFLYQPERYVARCSGVLLELMVRGVPVIVPDRCWLADQVRAAGGHRSIGLIYQDRAEIPGLMEQFLSQQESIRERARQHAKRIATRHSGISTLRAMGMPEAHPVAKAA